MNKLFAVHKLNAVGLAKAGAIASDFEYLLKMLELNCPEGREFSIVMTKLEEAAFFAKKSMAQEVVNQE